MKQTSEPLKDVVGGGQSRLSKGNDVKRICGDGLSVRLDSNEQALEVTGDGCRITMAKNCGSVRVVGDGCKLRIAHNVGDVEYNGDGGRVLLGPRSSMENVRYIGDGGKVTVDTDTEAKTRKDPLSSRARCETKDTPRISVKERIQGTDRMSMKIGKNSFRNQDKDSASVTIETENALNEEREAKLSEGNEGRRRLDKKKPDKSVTVKTKIVTVVGYDSGEYTRKWFVGSGNVFRSFNGCPVETLPTGAKIVVDGNQASNRGF